MQKRESKNRVSLFFASSAISPLSSSSSSSSSFYSNTVFPFFSNYPVAASRRSRRKEERKEGRKKNGIFPFLLLAQWSTADEEMCYQGFCEAQVEQMNELQKQLF